MVEQTIMVFEEADGLSADVKTRILEKLTAALSVEVQPLLTGEELQYINDNLA